MTMARIWTSEDGMLGEMHCSPGWRQVSLEQAGKQAEDYTEHPASSLCLVLMIMGISERFLPLNQFYPSQV
jgi:hypothetical protein